MQATHLNNNTLPHPSMQCLSLFIAISQVSPTSFLSQHSRCSPPSADQMLQNSGPLPALTVFVGARCSLPVFSLAIHAALHNQKRVGEHNLPTSGPGAGKANTDTIKGESRARSEALRPSLQPESTLRRGGNLVVTTIIG